ncbi:UDP-glucuronosyltransferase 2B15-like [Trichosurus vulpecula]|uniref:UDP-glucuronosyltransferase 2B15-like n=1 Tax=Trichosurus vulpecula TaxID=9337 RepID=UPI00186B0A7A|nr:UDP-glucuronosyltransferase 2B15-like [Trichosurus vulpecula]
MGTIFGGNVLIWPMECSHWLNIKIILGTLIENQHNVTVLVASGEFFITPATDSPLKFEVYKISFGKENIESIIRDFVLTWLEHKPSPSTIWRFYSEMTTVIHEFHQVFREICDDVLINQKLMEKLQMGKFDILISDPVFPCGDLIALKLGIPFIYSLRFSPASTVEKHCGKVPYPPSYVPAVLSELTDQMSFSDRIRNFISYHLQDYMFNTLWSPWDSHYSNILDGSHWLNIKIILGKLIEHQHNVTVLVASGALFITPTTDSPLKFEVYKVSFGKEKMENVIRDFVLTWLEHKPSPSTIWRFYSEMTTIIHEFHQVSRALCDGVLINQKLMEKLQKGKFDILISDPVFPCGDLIALKLGIPFIYSLRFSPASTVEKHCGKVPYPPSYVPAVLSELTDQMSFSDRIRNFISYHLQDYMFNTLWSPWDSYYSNILGKKLFLGWSQECTGTSCKGKGCGSTNCCTTQGGRVVLITSGCTEVPLEAQTLRRHLQRMLNAGSGCCSYTARAPSSLSLAAAHRRCGDEMDSSVVSLLLKTAAAVRRSFTAALFSAQEVAVARTRPRAGVECTTLSDHPGAQSSRLLGYVLPS